MPRAPDNNSTRPPPPGSGADPPGIGCAPTSPVAIPLTCPCCHRAILVHLSAAACAAADTPPVPPHPPPSRTPAAPVSARYALLRAGDFWELWLQGQHATLPHQQGLLYAGHMLAHPGIHVKKLYLATRYARAPHGTTGITEAWDEAHGQVVALGRQPVIQDPVTSADNEEARRRLQCKARALKAVLDDPAASESEKSEAKMQRQQIADFLRQDSRPSRDEYKKAADSVRCALNRLVGSLLKAEGPALSPHQVKREFARQLEEYLLNPSRRYSVPGARPARGDLAGCLIFEPPAGVRWVVSF